MTSCDNKHVSLRCSRRIAREFALLGVYSSLIDEEADYAAIEANLLSVISEEVDGEGEGAPAVQAMAECDINVEDFAKCDQEFFREILSGVIAEKAVLIEAVAKHLDRDPKRLSVVERACLLIGAWELAHRIDIPYRVVINEAVELSKQFGSDKGYRFVNGVLDKVAADLRSVEVSA